METNRLRQFLAVTETLNLRKAAELLGVSHGGLFKSLKVLEEELGFELFQREGRGLVLTEKGRRLLPRARKFLDAQEEFLGADGAPSAGLRIGTFEVFSTYFFSSVLLKAVEESSYLVRELVPGALEQALLEEEIDVGITYEPVPLQGLKILKITQFSMAVFGLKDAFGATPLEQLPFAAPALPINTHVTGVKGLDGWPDDRVPRTIRFRVDMMETALQLCSAGRAVGYFPEFVVALYNQTRAPALRIQKIPAGKLSVKRKVYLVLRSSAEETSVIKKIARSLRQTCAGSEGNFSASAKYLV